MSSIRVKAEKVDFDFRSTSLKAGRVVCDYQLEDTHPLYPRARVEIQSVASVIDGTPGRCKDVASLLATPAELRSFCEDTLRKLDMAEGELKRKVEARQRRDGHR